MGTECSLSVQKNPKFKENMSIEKNCSVVLVFSVDRYSHNFAVSVGTPVDDILYCESSNLKHCTNRFPSIQLDPYSS
jgi:hypothetical protein